MTNLILPNPPSDFTGYNDTGSTIPAFSAVRITGAFDTGDGVHPTLDLTLSDDANTMPCAGITTDEILDGGTGTVRSFGIIASIDTSAFTDGDPLYISDTVPGGFSVSNNEPVSIEQRVATVLLSDATEGAVFVCLNPQMDGHTSYTNRDQFLIFSATTTSALRLFASGGEVVLVATPTGSRLITLPDATGVVVFRDTTDTLSNKTLLIPIIASFVNAVHNHQNAAGGGKLAGLSALNDVAVTAVANSIVVGTGSAKIDSSWLTEVLALADLSDVAPGAVLSGSNTGDQTITLTGDVTGTGTGSFAATIASNAVTMAKLADIATQTVIGRGDAGTGDPSALTLETGITVTTGEVLKASGRWLRETRYTTGSSTHTPGADCNSMDVEGWGGGGGGGGADQAGAGQAGAAGGGAGGAQCRKRAANSGTYAVVIPAAAAGGAAGNNAGAAGGDGTFTGTNFALVAKGGAGGSGGASTATSNANIGGVGIAATGGDINGAGTSGFPGAVINGASGVAFSGAGGGTPYGRGGTGRTSHGAGGAATGAGCGGAGAVAVTASTPRAGGAGTEAIWIVNEYS